MKIVVKQGAGTQTISFVYTTDDVITPATIWNTVTGKKGSLLLENMPVGKYLSLKIITTGSNNQRLTTDVVRKMIA